MSESVNKSSGSGLNCSAWRKSDDNVSQNHHDLSNAFESAVCNGRTGEIVSLLKKGAKIDAPLTEDNRPALMIAILYDEYEVAKILVEKGADVNAETKGEDNALYFAAQAGQSDLVELIAEKASEKTKMKAVKEAARLNDFNAMVQLNKAHVSRNSADEHGSTALLELVDLGKCENVERLLTWKANVNKARNDGLTPLMYAVMNEDKPMVELLLRYKADINAEDEDGYTALWHAEDRDLHDIAGLLRK